MIKTEWIELVEYQPTRIHDNNLSKMLGEFLWLNYQKEINIEFPSLRTNNALEFTSKGYVGYIPYTKNIGLYLKPRISIINLFKILEYVYNLKSFKFIDGLTDCETVLELYERIIRIFLRVVQDRLRKGLYKEYVEQTEILSYLTGSMDIKRKLVQPEDIQFNCIYQDLVTDIEDNQIVTWALRKVVINNICSEDTMNQAKRAYRYYLSQSSLQPISPSQCLGRKYNRLNEDYQLMHSLCKFILDQESPEHSIGEQKMKAFLVNMPSLFEDFISKWLEKWLSIYYPNKYKLICQEKVFIDNNGLYKFKIDLVLYDLEVDSVKAVLDTKYKINKFPSAEDISQIVTYSLLKDCKEAILIYPTKNIRKFNENVRDICVRSIGFPLEGDFDSEIEKRNFIFDLLSN